MCYPRQSSLLCCYNVHHLHASFLPFALMTYASDADRDHLGSSRLARCSKVHRTSRRFRKLFHFRTHVVFQPALSSCAPHLDRARLASSRASVASAERIRGFLYGTLTPPAARRIHQKLRCIKLLGRGHAHMAALDLVLLPERVLPSSGPWRRANASPFSFETDSPLPGFAASLTSTRFLASRHHARQPTQAIR